ncbi:MAG: hypothetical protein HOP13_11020 [Alphaproteobacteria bacterium]|nr:hypothetical protein [Alphaproteobacteria bacterium]
MANDETSHNRLAAFALWGVARLLDAIYLAVAGAILFYIFKGVMFVAALTAAQYVIMAVADAASPAVARVAAVGDALAAVDPLLPYATILLAVLVLYFPLLRLVEEMSVRIGLLQDWIQSIFTGSVDAAFQRSTAEEARKSAQLRRNKITRFVTAHVVPSTKLDIKYSVTSASTIREYVERRQEVDSREPLRVAEFIERPSKSPISRDTAYVEGIDEIAGQFVRLNFERPEAQPKGFWAGVWDMMRQAPPEDVIIPLLQRVVDAAVLADQHFDDLREEKGWKGMPFFELIYAEWRPIPRLLHLPLRIFVGNLMPARVVIETQYPDVFRHALFGDSRPHWRKYRGWFGIGIQFVKPSPRVQRRAWWAQPQVLCRRLKSHVAGSMSQRFHMRSAGDAPWLQSNVRIMPCGPLADGCPSVVTPHLVRRGTVSQAPSAWLFQAERQRLAKDCQGFCLKNLPKDDRTPPEMILDASSFGMASTPAADLRERYWGPRRPWKLLPSMFRRRVWIGAMTDKTLRQASRFPIYGCKLRFADTLADRLRPTGSDMNGTLVRQVRTPGEVLTDLSKRFAARWTGDDVAPQSKGFGGAIVSYLGPDHAPHVLVPEPLLKDYLNHIAQIDRVVAILPAPENEPPLVPKPEKVRAR